MKNVMPVVPGDAVRVVDEQYVEHVGLVTYVHGNFLGAHTPAINVVYVTKDASRTDPYGQQIDRMSSLQHLSQGPSQMETPGRYWENI